MGRLVIAVVCHQGIGSSLWLKILVQKVVDEYGLSARVIQTDLTSLAGEAVDIIVGMDYLRQEIVNYGKTHILINNILDTELKDKLLNNEMIKNMIG